ncbi:hypothetical protein JCM1841_002636 [Sporobolomyces salmonicolor]
MLQVQAPLSPGTGYGVVIGLGALFALGMIGISNLLARGGNSEDNEEFTVAKRSLKTGLTAAGVVSSWTWSTTLLSSCSVAYQYGVAGAFFYAVCNSTQIMIFSNLAIQSKRKAPNAHTFLEIMRVRYGRFVHLTFLFFAFSNNTLVVSSVLLGGAAAINALTGMSIYASIWLLPISVAAYTLRGGLRATLYTDWLHTVIIFVLILTFWFKTYATSDLIGSPSKMFDLLNAAQIRNGDAATRDHSYLTVRSLGALKFGVLSLLEYAGVVFLDNSFHSKAVAASPEAAVPGYILGGISWIASPFTLATTMGLVAIALENTPAFPTFPRRMTAEETSAGLVLPYAAQTIMGKGGAAAVLLLVFMSCTSAISSQLIGISTVLSYDVFKTYFKPSALDRHLLRASHISVVIFSLWMAGFASMLHGAGIDLGFIYNMTGIFTCPGLPPLILTFFSSRQGALAAATSVWLGFVAGIAAWLSLAHRLYGEVTVATVGNVDPCLYACVTGIAVSAFVTGIITLFRPAHYDWESLSAVRIVADDGKQVDVAFEDPSYNPERLRKAAWFARGAALFLFVAIFVLWPFPLYGTGYIFSKPFFTGWVVVGCIWAFFSISAVGVLPLIESRHGIVDLARSVFGKGSPAARPRASTPPTPPSPDGTLDEDVYSKALDDREKIGA